MNSQRGQHGKDVGEEMLLEPGHVGGREIRALDDRHAFCGQELAHLAPDVLLLGLKGEPGRRDTLQLLRRSQPVDRPGRDTLAHLGAQARDPHHEELVEIVGRDRQEPQPLEQRMGGVLRLLQHPAIELQPGELAIDEPAGMTGQRFRRVGPARVGTGRGHRRPGVRLRLGRAAVVHGSLLLRCGAFRPGIRVAAHPIRPV
jgi:hypothetical protein